MKNIYKPMKLVFTLENIPDFMSAGTKEEFIDKFNNFYINIL